MTDRLETCRVYRATIPLSFLQISDLYTVPTRFYESLNEKNRMCELYKSGCIIISFRQKSFLSGHVNSKNVHSSKWHEKFYLIF